MKVFTGTKSEQKIQHVTASLTAIGLTWNDLQGFDVESGIDAQPFGTETTKRGARNRAEQAYAAGTKDDSSEAISVGLEAGLETVNNQLALVCVADIFDGRNHHIGMSKPLIIPAGVANKVRAGNEFGDEIRLYKPSKDSGFDTHIIDELITREVSFRMAMEEALSAYLLAHK